MPDEACDQSSPEPDADEPCGPKAGALVLVSTPIGNLADISPRAIEALRSADLILCEDTRTTSRLLARHDIRTRTEALHEHNESARIGGLLRRLQAGRRLALVSDAGTPLISDPGFRLARAALAEGIALEAIPGPSAAIMALTLSGLPPLPFLMLGFAPPRQAGRRAAFTVLRAAEAAGLSATLIWHEAPHRLAETLRDLLDVLGDRPAAVARELTKRFEEVRRGKLSALAAHYAGAAVLGEITLVVGPGEAEAVGEAALDRLLAEALATHGVREAAELVAAATGVSRRVVYARALGVRKGEGQGAALDPLGP